MSWTKNRWAFLWSNRGWLPSLDLPSFPTGPDARGHDKCRCATADRQCTAQVSWAKDAWLVFCRGWGPPSKRIRHKKKSQTVSKHHFAGSQGFLCSCLVLKNVGVKPEKFRTKGATGQHITIGPGNVSTKHQKNIGRCVMMVFVWQRKNQQQTEIVLVTIWRIIQVLPQLLMAEIRQAPVELDSVSHCLCCICWTSFGFLFAPGFSLTSNSTTKNKPNACLNKLSSQLTLFGNNAVGIHPWKTNICHEHWWFGRWIFLSKWSLFWRICEFVARVLWGERCCICLLSQTFSSKKKSPNPPHPGESKANLIRT